MSVHFADRSARNAAILADYASGKSMRALAARYEMSVPGIRNVLISGNAKIRDNRRLRQPMFEIVMARANNHLLREIATDMGVVPSQISNLLRSIGADQMSVKAVKRLKPNQVEVYRAALDEDHLSHADALDVAREGGCDAPSL
ncbi:hypothetical protein U0C82_03810 [Fulvimarina sp. 2208YS6-2-32]|uniref:Uncharacterized protein n=1 Tax=Fulvimarina uroteuthidis TaxID=3098149 RepID=A0ABU5HZ10_9HYPH|nr:hypothetical protein [Fulvimarina sp. 2208YS6-2-32]MDY8108275.1 hypothetical protein [Fulvimarina sp. 2208YS6-2-32]